MIHVLFVCLGNICRSPMAEAVFAHKVRHAALANEIKIESAGTGDWHVGSPPHHGTAGVLSGNNIAATGRRARQITRADLGAFDYVITMDEANLAAVRALGGAGNAVIVSLMTFAPGAGVAEVPDPYYAGGFDNVYRLIDQACDGLLAALRREHGL